MSNEGIVALEPKYRSFPQMGYYLHNLSKIKLLPAMPRSNARRLFFTLQKEFPVETDSTGLLLPPRGQDEYC